MQDSRTPLVSILVPVYNGESTIARAIASLRVQTVQDWEAIVVDDASTDHTNAVVRAIPDDRLRVFSAPTNRGRGATRQFALAQASGEYLAMLDADDWWYPWKLEQQLRTLESQPSVGLVSCAMASVDQNGQLRGVWRSLPDRGEVAVFPPLRSLLDVKAAHAPSMIKMHLAKGSGYGHTLKRAEDWYFLGRLLERTHYAISPEALYAYTDAQSYQREGGFNRYLWTAVASLQLWKRYPVSATLVIAKSIPQALISSLTRKDIATLWRHPGAASPTDHQRFDEASQTVRAAAEELL